METDIPFKEHIEFYPNCPYIRYIEGHTFKFRTKVDYLHYTVTGMQSINNNNRSLTVGCRISNNSNNTDNGSNGQRAPGSVGNR